MSLPVAVDVVMTDTKFSNITMSPLHLPEISNLVERILAEQPRYIGIYAPGDFHVDNYRIIMPDVNALRPGRGFRGLREEVLIELEKRGEIDRVIERIQDMVGTCGLLAVRHIKNPSTSKDEGFRLVWSRDGQLGEVEMADWPRRDKMIREGKTVVEIEGAPDQMLGEGMHGFWGYQPWFAMAMDVDMSVGMGIGAVDGHELWYPVTVPMTLDE